eukprot:CAMPEP_0203858650 /NCGR_PEP_ID=MMETSP0359-20131031/11399_1 /ASSEMBLY_ACC=CAM_ASM_000338 /TAXON_ID=268821 /ORGANISM="Scrippsiella Hangoei, Strain SHTV-5" /LENGTH=101 /DNA_ID=CAMNT_0050775459 /DNA_START=89 /DNA_END=394 /DNA_ORIENTATION=-
MAARMLIALVFAVAFVAAFLPSGSPSFVSAPSAGGAVEAPALRGAPAAASAVAYGALAASAPMPAEAWTEKGLLQFGQVFALFFLFFWVAGFVRMMTIGRL